MSQHSIVIEMVEKDALLGTVVIRDGEIWSARDATGEGTDALRRLLFNPRARASVYGLDKTMVGQGNITGGWQQILLDAARVHDEETDLAARDLTPPPGSRPQPTPEPEGRFELPLEPAPPDEAGFEALMEHAVEALLKRRFADAHRMFAQAAKLRPTDPRIKDNLARLTRFGFGRH